MRILIKDNWNDIVLETNVENYEKDIKNADMDLWWCVKVEYHDDTWLVNKAGRRVVIVNNRSVYAEWNISIEGHMDVTKELIEFLNTDFKTIEVASEIEKEQKAYKAYMKQTHKPVKIKIPAKTVEVLEELIDG